MVTCAKRIRRRRQTLLIRKRNTVTETYKPSVRGAETPRTRLKSTASLYSKAGGGEATIRSWKNLFRGMKNRSATGTSPTLEQSRTISL